MAEASRSRRDEYSEATRQALVDSARRLFIDRGWSRASTEEIVRAARVTKGALYHHFEGKQSLFEAVLEAMEQDAQAKIVAVYEAETDPWQGVVRSLDVFLELCADTDYGRIVFVEGPIALGWPRWREMEDKYGYRLTEALLAALMEAGELAESPLGATTAVAFGMLGHAGLALAEAAEADRARLKEELRSVIMRLMEGMRPIGRGRRRRRS